MCTELQLYFFSLEFYVHDSMVKLDDTAKETFVVLCMTVIHAVACKDLSGQQPLFHI